MRCWRLEAGGSGGPSGSLRFASCCFFLVVFSFLHVFWLAWPGGLGRLSCVRSAYAPSAQWPVASCEYVAERQNTEHISTTQTNTQHSTLNTYPLTTHKRQKRARAMESKKRRMEIDTETLIERRRDLAEERTAEPGARWAPQQSGGWKQNGERTERAKARAADARREVEREGRTVTKTRARALSRVVLLF